MLNYLNPPSTLRLLDPSSNIGFLPFARFLKQEHRSLIKRASAGSRKNSWATPAQILKHCDIVAPRH
jgi:hypothetical protein